jgi:hypothetical protein
MQSPLEDSKDVRPIDLLQIAIEREDHDEPTVIDFRDGRNDSRRQFFEPLVSTLLAPSATDFAANPEDDVEVPAGRLAGTVRVPSSNSEFQTKWVNPHVPFDGTVKVHMWNNHDYVLLAYGENDATTILSAVATDRAFIRRPFNISMFVGTGIVIGDLTGTSVQSSTVGLGLLGTVGAHVSEKLDVLIESDWLSGERYSPVPNLQQDSGLALFGARWFPLRPPASAFGYLDLHNLFVQVDAGAAYINRRSSGVTASNNTAGMAIGGDIGFSIVRRKDCQLSYVISDRLGIYGAGEGIRQNLAGMMTIDITP